MTPSTPTFPSPTNHPPLAHDDAGAPLTLPAGTTHWRILRGRDTQPARFGLEMTREDLLELCGPGTYTIEASDQYGHRLDHVATITVGEPPARPSSDRLVEVILDGAPQPDDKVTATAHVLRVRARLAADEQRAFDQLMREDAATRLIRTVLSRDEDDALAALRERLAERSKIEPLRSLSPEEQAIVMSTLLLRMSPAEASLVIRTYLAPDKTG